jgi:MFS family permease
VKVDEKPKEEKKGFGNFNNFFKNLSDVN